MGGAPLTVQLGAYILLLAEGWLALLGLYGPAPVRALVRAYVDVFRAYPCWCSSFWSITPPFVGLSSVPCLRDPAGGRVQRLHLEIARAGIEAVPKGQREGRCSG